MRTGKWLMILSLCSLLILIASNMVAPNSFLFWLADHSVRFQHVREALAVVLFIQLLPLKQVHSLMSRIIAGGIALAIAVWVVMNTYGGTMQLLDSFSLMAGAVAVGISALDGSYTSSKHKKQISNPMLA